MFAFLYLSDPKENSWALFFVFIIDVPLGLYIRCFLFKKPKEKPNDPPANKILKLSKDQNGMLVVDIDKQHLIIPLLVRINFYILKKKKMDFLLSLNY